MASTGILRVVRGSAAATLSTFVALLCHVAAGGRIPTLVGIAVPLVLSLAVCTVLAGRRTSAARLAASVVVSQFLFHVLFVLGAPTGISATGAATDGSAHMHSVVLTSTTLHTHSGGQTMWWAHAVAAMVTILALHRGESTMRRLAEIGRLAVATIAGDRLAWARTIRPVTIRRTTRPTLVARVDALRTRDGVLSRSRRGPPVGPIAV